MSVPEESTTVHSGLSSGPGTRVNPTAAALLGFLHEGPLSGWDLWSTAQLRIGDFWTVTRSQVYRELAAMDEAGLVQRGETGPRDRRPYAITDAGREAFREWIEAEPGTEQIRYPLLLKLAFGRHLRPDLVAEFVASHRQIHAERLEQYRALVPGLTAAGERFALATLDFGIRYETAVLEWFDHLPAVLDGGGIG
jgi:DNA-binding PadR family transcriptional regulator